MMMVYIDMGGDRMVMRASVMSTAFVPSCSASTRLRLAFGNGRAKNNLAVSSVRRRAAQTTPTTRRRAGVGVVMKDNYDDIAKSLVQEFGGAVGTDVAGSADSAFGAVTKPADMDASAVDQAVVVGKGKNDMETVTLVHAPSSQKVVMYTFGATLTSWVVRNGTVEAFFLSDEAAYDSKKAIRGGIPICFPQFGPGPDMRQHGFCRDSQWKVKERVVQSDGSVACVLSLSSSDQLDTFSGWADDKGFELEYTVILSYNGLETSLRVRNTGTSAFSFTTAFHNYFRVSDVSQAQVFGLENTRFVDKLDNNAEGHLGDEGGAGVNIEKATDRMHFGTSNELAVFDFQTLRMIKLKKTQSLPDGVIWNPYGSEGCDPGWRSFVCLEPAALEPVTVEPGAEWLGGQLLAVE